MIDHIYGSLCSQFYDATEQYATEQEVNFYELFIDKKNKDFRILEAMSGSGRLQIPLVERGYIIDGVDYSEAILRRCQERADQLGIQVNIYQQSLESLKLPHIYNLVTIAVGSFQLIINKQDALQALKKLHAHMYKDSYVFIDLFPAPRFYNTSGSTRIATLDNATSIRLTTECIYDEKNKISRADCLYELIKSGQVVQHEQEIVRVVYYTDQEFKELLQEAGFELVMIHKETFCRTGPAHIVQAQAR